MKTQLIALSLLVFQSIANAGFTSDIEARVVQAFKCSSKNSMTMKDADFTVRVTDIMKDGKETIFRGDAMVAWNVLKKPDQWEFYGSGNMVGDEFRISEIAFQDGSLKSDGKKKSFTLPGACVK